MDWRRIREDSEMILSKFAARSIYSKGRLVDEEKCPIRTDFERDHNRILYSVDFRRLRHKTQVFFNAKNDHICTRMEHVFYVGSITSTIARTLNLNQDLAYAIALGHDLGHAPFGHSGERVLDECLKRINKSLSFEHESHSLRVVDHLATRISRAAAATEITMDSGMAEMSGKVEHTENSKNSDNHENPENLLNMKSTRKGLNLTFEVRDGIVCHCGEKYNEYCVGVDRFKEPERLYDNDIRQQLPATLEGCVVRLADKIAYVGRDIEDAVRVGIMSMRDISKEVLGELGFTNGQIINTLVSDLIENSYGKDYISLSKEKGEALESLIKENVRTIYRSERISAYEKSMSNTMEGLFFGLYNILKTKGEEAMKDADERVLRRFYRYILDQEYLENVTPEQKVLDYVAGMTDGFALKCYEELYWM